MKLFKKLTALVLVLTMLFAFTACTTDGNGISGMFGSDSEAEDSGYSNAQIDNLIGNLQMALTALIDENSSSIAQLQEEFDSELSGLDTKDKALAKDIEKLKKDYDERIADLQAEINASEAEKESASSSYGKRIAALEEADKQMLAVLDSLKSSYEKKISELDKDIADTEALISELTGEYENKLADLEAAGAEANEKMTQLKTEYDAKVGEIDAKISAMENSITEYEAKILALETSANTNAADVAALRAEYEAKIVELEGKITECECDKSEAGVDYSDAIAALQSGVASNTTAIATLRAEYEAKIVELEGRITACEGEKSEAGVDYSQQIAALQSGIDANASSISALRAEYEAKVAELEGRIAACEEEKSQAGADYSQEIAALETEIATVKADIATVESTYGARIAALEESAGTLIDLDTTLAEAGKAADAKAVGDAIANINTSVAKLTDLLEPKAIYGYVYTAVDTTSEDAATRSGYYLAPSGKSVVSSSYAYTQKIDVLPGDVVHLTGYYPEIPTNSLNYANKYSMRMACVYNAEGTAVSSLGFSVGSGYTEFTIGEGGAQISVTYTMGSFKNGFVPVVARYTPVGETFVLKDSSNSASVIAALAELETMKTDVEALKTDVAALDVDKIQELSDNIVTLNAKIDALDVDALNEAIDSIKNLDTNGMNIMVNAALGSSSIVATADKLVEGTPLELENNTIINNKNLTFTCDLPAEGLGEGVIRLGHGKTSYGASYVEITATTIYVYNYSSGPSLVGEFTHGLTLSDYVTFSIDADYHWAEFKLATSTGYYTNSKNWQGRNGAIFAEVEGVEVTNVSMRWFSEEYQNPIWMVGDSYFNSKDGSRWTSYLVSTGYKNFLMMSYPGMASERGLTEVKQALTHGTPQYIIWCMGMNNGDSIANNTINESYLAATNEFLQICEEKGITPILSTIPSTPTVLNEPKNEWVREWARTTGGRYIDFSRAVCNETYDASLIGQVVSNASATSEKVNKTGYKWYDGMIHSDAVHPATLGAQALFMQFLADFPEIMREK